MGEQVSPTVLVASDEFSLLDEVARFVEEIPHWKTASSTHSVEELIEAITATSPDVLLVSDSLAKGMLSHRGVLRGVRVVVFGREEKIETLRVALALSARGFVVWPEQRRDLQVLVESGAGVRSKKPAARSPLTAVWSPKGGSGTSVLAAHLAAAMAIGRDKVTLVDLDLDHGDQKLILGADQETKTLSDLIRVVDEIGPSVVQAVAWRHSSGFDAILSAGSVGNAGQVKDDDVLKVVSAIRATSSHVIVDLPSGNRELVLSVAEEATSFLWVITPDLLSLKRARDALRSFRAGGMDPQRIDIVVNQFTSGDVTLADIEAVVGRQVMLTIRPDLALYRSVGRGEISKAGIKLLEPVVSKLTGVTRVSRRWSRT
ncbi:MAG: P-loop NTPase [Actinomycetota bacterium]